MRINQVARKYGLENRDILTYLESISVQGKSHSSSIDDATLEMLLGHFDKLETKESEPAQNSNQKFARIRRPKNWTGKKEIPIEEEQPIVSRETGPIEDKTKEIKSVGERKPIETALLTIEPEKVEAEITEKSTVQMDAIAEEKVELDLQETSLEIPGKQKPEAVLKVQEVFSQRMPGKKDKKAAKGKRVDRDKRAGKKPKLRTIPLERDKTPGEPEIIIEAPEIDINKIEEGSVLPVVMVKDRDHRHRDTASKHDQDDAIRREIQRLKIKQKRIAEPEEIVPESPVPIPVLSRPAGAPTSGRRRPPMAVKKKGKGKLAWKREKRERREMQLVEEEKRVMRDSTILKIHDASTVADIASGLGIPVNELIQKLISLGVMASINQRLDMETVQVIADDYHFQVEEVDLYGSDIFNQIWEEDTKPERMTVRPPVVTIMGHVDHGKTKLLDAVRSTDVVSQEAGGITQHIGAYYVKTTGGDIVFLDTPGHEAFTAMRARGAMVTDIVVLVVSAADGVMPQTVEAIHHAKAADVPIIVALNKIDLESANPDRVKQQLSEHGLITEDWGGKTVMAHISAKQKIGIDELLESILLQAELLELKADPQCRARGTIVEGRLEQGRGAVATVLLQQGNLQVGDPFVTGVFSGRIRAMMNDRGETIDKAGPSMPVEIIGIENVPSAGDPFIVVQDDNQAKQISARLQQIQREREMRRAKHITLDDLHHQILQGEIKELRVIVKGDVQGSVGAITENLSKIESEKVRIETIHSGVGAITESDVMLASASNAIIIGFNMRPHPQVLDVAKREHVDIRSYRIIYDAINDIRKAMTGMLDKTFEERILGRGEVREVFRLSKGISIAGLYIQDGLLQRNAPIRLLRDSVVVHEGKLSSLKRFKDDVREVQSGFECGIGLEKFSDIREGDVIECFMMEEVAPTL